MTFILNTTTNVKEAARFITGKILNQLKVGKSVLLFLAGGSSIPVGVKIAEILRNNGDVNLIKNLTITLTDERYGLVNHTDSNWKQLDDFGFNLPKVKIIPILTGEDRDITVKKFNDILHEKLTKEVYKIGLFGVGADGHTAGMLPGSGAVKTADLVFGYDAGKFTRITLTAKAIEKLDEAVIWAQGEEKWRVIESLLNKDVEILKQPVQVFKKVPLVTIFSDFPAKDGASKQE